MPNRDRLSAILSACDQFDAGDLPLASLQSAIESNGAALESVSKSVYATLHGFCNTLEKIEYACLAERQHEEGKRVTSELRKYLPTIAA